MEDLRADHGGLTLGKYLEQEDNSRREDEGKYADDSRSKLVVRRHPFACEQLLEEGPE